MLNRGKTDHENIIDRQPCFAARASVIILQIFYMLCPEMPDKGAYAQCH